MARTSFGDLLLQRGFITQEQLLAARHEQQVTKERIGKILVRNGFLRQSDLLDLLREVNPAALHDEAVYQDLIPASILLETRTMLSAVIGDAVYVSTLSPQPMVRRKLEPFVKEYKLVFTGANPVKLNDYLGQLKSGSVSTGFSWERAIHNAMHLRASDIHIIPRYNSYTVMYRRDGVMQIAHEGPKDEYIALVSRIKDLSRMDMAERRRPQDGGFSLDYSGRVVAFRVVTVPTSEGERMVVRILDPDSANQRLEALGITRVDVWRRAVSKSDGLCLICGPTGSGKTTTLAATTREMNFLERAVYTAEDPVEHRIPYAGQVNVNAGIDLTFSSAVRTFMRADPDVIILGEVRDIDTARNALKASETGHLVIATLHTDSILNAISRLKDIGVAPYELKHLLRGVMVQRLIRVYCKECLGAGCPRCGNSGYKGRKVVSEVACFDTDEEVQGALDGKLSWPVMRDDAIEMVERGLTSAKEIERVFGEGYVSEYNKEKGKDRGEA